MHNYIPLVTHSLSISVHAFISSDFTHILIVDANTVQGARSRLPFNYVDARMLPVLAYSFVNGKMNRGGGGGGGASKNKAYITLVSCPA